MTQPTRVELVREVGHWQSDMRWPVGTKCDARWDKERELWDVQLPDGYLLRMFDGTEARKLLAEPRIVKADDMMQTCQGCGHSQTPPDTRCARCGISLDEQGSATDSGSAGVFVSIYLSTILVFALVVGLPLFLLLRDVSHAFAAGL